MFGKLLISVGQCLVGGVLACALACCPYVFDMCWHVLACCWHDVDRRSLCSWYGSVCWLVNLRSGFARFRVTVLLWV